MIRKPGLCHESFNIDDKWLHAPLIARYRVQVNARNNVIAAELGSCYSFGMTEGWFERLEQAIENDDRSYTKISADAGLGRNFVQQMLKYRKEPGTDKLFKILDALGSSKAVYIMIGWDISDDDIDFLKSMSELSPAARADAVRFFRTLANTPSEQEPERVAR